MIKNVQKTKLPIQIYHLIPVKILDLTLEDLKSLHKQAQFSVVY